MFRVQSGGRMIRSQKTQPAKEHGLPQTISTRRTTEPTATEAVTRTHTASRVAPLSVVPLQAHRHTATNSNNVIEVTAEQAREMFRQGDIPNALIVTGRLNLSGSTWLRTLPTWLRCTALIVDDCPQLSVLPSDLHAEKLSARRTPALRELEGRISVREGINLTGSGVRMIHADLHATRLSLANCQELLSIRGQVSVAHLDVRGCRSLTRLDPSVHVAQTIDVADSGLTALPAHIHAGLRWNGVSVDARIAFTPELLTGRDIMNISNVQRRRVLLERLGVERFLADVGGLILDRDTDAGGERQLVRVPFNNDEDLVAVLVKCPSTGGQYALRVPPHIRSCREAVAWTAGMSEREYNIIEEA